MIRKKCIPTRRDLGEGYRLERKCTPSWSGTERKGNDLRGNVPLHGLEPR